ncbi:MAG: TolC family protein [Bacteroidales bacterium]|nr:TolC family protein [Bacteroidales bacterium]
MKRAIRTILAAALIISLSGCGIFRKYTPEETNTDNIFGEGVRSDSSEANASIAAFSWREFFNDPVLESIIDSALVRNVDMKAARLNVEQASATLKAAKLSFIPSLAFTPSIEYSQLGRKSENGITDYTIPLSIQWGSGFGGLTNRKREAQALSELAGFNEMAIQSQLIATVAEAYIHLQFLDREMEIMEATEEIWEKVLETQKALVLNGRNYSPSVDQMESSLLTVRIQKVDVAENIKTIENTLCRLLAKTPGHIERSRWEKMIMPALIGTGVPAEMLAARPDVQAALKNVEAAYYVTNQARGAFFPNLTLSGIFGWSNNGITISDPLEILINASASLVQPIFAQGQLKQQLKISKLQQEAAYDDFAQKVVDAGNQVNTAISSCQFCAQREGLYRQQVERLQSAFNGTSELMLHGKASYIEVLIAQESLYNAKLSEANNIYQGSAALINLYIALGGGCR